MGMNISSCKRGRTPTQSILGSDDDDNHAPLAGLHPLLNDLILSNMFKDVPVEQLATCRLVCRAWHDITLSTWRSSKTLRLTARMIWAHTWNGSDQTSIEEFMKFWVTQCDIRPYRQFNLQFFELGKHKERKMEREVDKFWEVVGPHMSKLRLYDCLLADTDVFFRTIVLHCPNLETLTLDKCTFSDTRVRKHCNSRYMLPVHGEHRNLRSLHICIYEHCTLHMHRFPYLELLTNFPRLTDISLDADNCCSEQLRVFMALRNLRSRTAGLVDNFPSLRLGIVGIVKTHLTYN